MMGMKVSLRSALCTAVTSPELRNCLDSTRCVWCMEEQERRDSLAVVVAAMTKTFAQTFAYYTL